MNNQTLPDFEKIALKWFPSDAVNADKTRYAFIQGMKQCWNDYVLSEEQKSDRIWGALHDKINDLQRELSLFEKSLINEKQKSDKLTTAKNKIDELLIKLINLEDKKFTFEEMEDIVMNFGFHWKTTVLPEGPVRFYFRQWFEQNIKQS